MCVNNIKTQTQHKIHETHNNTSTNHVLPSHNKIFDKIKVFFHHHDTREHKNFGPRVSVAVLPFFKKKKKNIEVQDCSGSGTPVLKTTEGAK